MTTRKGATMPRWPKEREARGCGIEGCEGKHVGKGYCKKHLYRLNTNGDPLAVRHRIHTGTVEERFWKKVVTGPDDCLLWSGAKIPDASRDDEDRYGMWTWDTPDGTQRQLAHRFAYESKFGKIPEGAQLHHTCARRGCVNPAHLQLATALENTAESLQRKHLTAKRDALVARYAELALMAQHLNIPLQECPVEPNKDEPEAPGTLF
ncbi:HNH endonuclease signature motif containing protein [Streptomyces zhihengii]